jgi:serine/threonine protein kinase
MEVYVKGKGKEVLDKRHYISAGGEGAVYAKQGTAYKLYTDISHMIPENKIRELSVLSFPTIIKPEDIVMDSKNHNIGYTMKYVTNTVTLCQIFTNAYKDRNKIKPKHILDLVNKLRDGIRHCHDKNILIVDLNELNFLVDTNKFDKVYFIDVDSYQTQSYPATAIMDSIRDRQAKKWSKETDWFSFGIIAFQMFVGIHPYKGRHPKYKQMDERMLNNVSVFNSAVQMPPTALALDTIPDIYKDWFKAVFEKGQRVPPPFGDAAVVVIQVRLKTVEGTDNFKIEVLLRYSNKIVKYFRRDAVLTESGLEHTSEVIAMAASVHMIVTSKQQHMLAADIKDNQLTLTNVTKNADIPYNSIAADQIMSYDNRLYIKNNDIIQEVDFMEINANKIIIGLNTICNIIPGATQVFDGVIVQNLLGSYFVSLFPDTHLHYQIKVSELTGYRIIDAKYENKVLVIIGEKKGKYDSFILKFNDTYSEYSIRITKDVSYSGINFTVLDNGICVYINQDDYTELFFNKKDNTDVKLIKDTALAGGMLFHEGNTTLLARDTILYSIKMK